MSRSAVLCEPRGPGLGSIKPNEMRHAQAFVALPKRGNKTAAARIQPCGFCRRARANGALPQAIAVSGSDRAWHSPCRRIPSRAFHTRQSVAPQSATRLERGSQRRPEGCCLRSGCYVHQREDLLAVPFAC